MAKKKTTSKKKATKRAKPASKRSSPTKKSASKKVSASKASSGRTLDDLRVRIDRLDKQLISMLNERAQLVVDIGQLKRSDGTPIYAPHREAEVLDRVLGANEGPLPPRTIEGVYREIMSGSFALEQPLRIGYLGPPGSYSHHAAACHFGSSVEFDDLHTVAGVFTEVQRGHVDYGLVPIENSLGGGIVDTLDAFRDVGEDVTVYAEVQINIHHSLLANCEPQSVRRIHSKPEVFTQCRTWLATQYPNAELVPEASSSRAVQKASEEYAMAAKIGAEPGSAAIGSALAGEIYGLRTLFAKIEDDPNNITRFFVISKQKAQRSGDDKTSLMFMAADKPGALVHVLQVFERAGINLSHIDKRPSGRTNWQYAFFLDACGHRDDAAMSEAIGEVEGHCKELTVLGSYPRSKRIL